MELIDFRAYGVFGQLLFTLPASLPFRVLLLTLSPGVATRGLSDSPLSPFG